MIKYQIDGLEKMIKGLRDTQAIIPTELIDKAVKESAEFVVLGLKEEYRAAGHVDKGTLINSIQTYKRKRKGKNDPWFTYYVGPKYGKGGGNHAHFLEYGVLYSAYPIKGQGMSISGRKYGKFDTRQGFRIKPTGVVRRTTDKMRTNIETKLGKAIYTAILDRWEARGARFYKTVKK